MKIKYQKIYKETGLQFDEPSSILFYVKRHLDYLKAHNKNYTKEQYYRIEDLFYIFDNIEIEE